MADAVTSAEPALAARRITHVINKRTILHEVSAAFWPGELSVIIGPNGAGKSTLISLLSADAHPVSGHGELFGTPVHRYSPRSAARLRAVMGQHTAVSFPYPAGEVIAMGRTPWRGTQEADHDESAITAAAQDAETEHLLERPVTLLSGGERQRIALARVLAQRPWHPSPQRPPVLLFDEPVSALDIRHQERTLRLLRRLADEGACVVVVLHDLDAAAAYADRLVILNEGTVLADGPPQQVCDPELLSEVYRTPIQVLRDDAQGLLGVGPKR